MVPFVEIHLSDSPDDSSPLSVVPSGRMKERAKNTELAKREIPMNPATMNGSDRPRVNAILPSFFVSGPDTLVVVSYEEELLEPSYSACCSHQLPSSSGVIF